MLKTKKYYQHNADVYQWIEELKNNPANEEVQEKIIQIYTNLVHSLARKYSYHNIHDDLVQVGMIGLLTAARRYDNRFGKTFETYAIPTIIGEIKRYMRDQTWSVHVPRRIKELGPQIKRAVDHLMSDKGRSPTIDEIAFYLNVSIEDIIETMEIGRSYRALSVDCYIETDLEGNKTSLLDLIGHEDIKYETIDNQILLEQLLVILSPRERKVIQHIFFSCKSQKETGDLLGLSQMHVSRLQRKSLKKLQSTLLSLNIDFSKI